MQSLVVFWFEIGCVHADFHDDDNDYLLFINTVVFLCRLYVPFAYAFYPATVVSVILCAVLLGVPFFWEMSFGFFLKLSSSFSQLFFLLVLFVYLQWHTVGVESKVPSIENLELWKILPLKPGAGQSIAMHAFPTAMKVFIVLSNNIYLSSPFTMTFSKIDLCYIFHKM